MIDEKKLISRIESQYRQWGDEYDVQQILGDIDDFPKACEWIPCSERLPENCSSVLMYSVLQGVEQGCYNPSTDTWIMFRWGELTGKVTHWRHLPEKPYEVKENE